MYQPPLSLTSNPYSPLPTPHWIVISLTHKVRSCHEILSTPLRLKLISFTINRLQVHRFSGLTSIKLSEKCLRMTTVSSKGTKHMQFPECGIPQDESEISTSDKKKSLLQKLRSLTMAPHQLMKQYAAGERDFRGLNLSYQILSRVDLSRADFTEAKLDHIVLEGAILMRVNLSKANLAGANLRRADLIWANLRGANLQGANLRGADLSGADLSGANLTGADLGGAILPDGSVLLSSQPSSLRSFSSE